MRLRDAPLADPAVLAARRAALAAPHMAPLARFAAGLRATTGRAVPARIAAVLAEAAALLHRDAAA